MDKNKIMLMFAENYRYVSDRDLHKAIGYCDVNKNICDAVCAAVITLSEVMKCQQ